MTALLITNELVHLVSYVVSQLGKASPKSVIHELLSYQASTSVVLVVSFGIALALIHADHRQGYISSGLMFTFWLVLFTGLSLVLYSKIVKLTLINHKVSFFIILALLKLNAFRLSVLFCSGSNQAG